MIYNTRVDFHASDHSWKGEGGGFERKVLRVLCQFKIETKKNTNIYIPKLLIQNSVNFSLIKNLTVVNVTLNFCSRD